MVHLRARAQAGFELFLDGDNPHLDDSRRSYHRRARGVSLIICAHLSTRYHPQEVKRLVESKMPPQLRERIRLWL
jgi:ribonuclease Z